MPEGHLPDPLYIWLNAGVLCPQKQDMRNWKKPVEYMTCALQKNTPVRRWKDWFELIFDPWSDATSLGKSL